MKNPAANSGVSQELDKRYLNLVTPNVFIGGPVIVSPGFPLEACGNDGLRRGINSTQTGAGVYAGTLKWKNSVDMREETYCLRPKMER
jgi:hypothetical protein